MIFVYVDDLLIAAESTETLISIADALKAKCGTVTSHIVLEHDFLGMHWDFRESPLSEVPRHPEKVVLKHDVRGDRAALRLQCVCDGDQGLCGLSGYQ
jgi:hypothetical protein